MLERRLMGKLRSSKLSSDRLPVEVKLPIEVRWIKKVMVVDPNVNVWVARDVFYAVIVAAFLLQFLGLWFWD